MQVKDAFASSTRKHQGKWAVCSTKLHAQNVQNTRCPSSWDAVSEDVCGRPKQAEKGKSSAHPMDRIDRPLHSSPTTKRNSQVDTHTSTRTNSNTKVDIGSSL